MQEFIRTYWLLDPGTWVLILIVGLGMGTLARSKRLSAIQSFFLGGVAMAALMLGAEAWSRNAIGSPLWPLAKDATQWMSLILPRTGFWAALTGLVSLFVSRSRARRTEASVPQVT